MKINKTTSNSHFHTNVLSLPRLKDGSQADNGVESTSDITGTTAKYSYAISSASVSDTGMYQCTMASTSAGTTVKSLVMPLYVRGELL